MEAARAEGARALAQVQRQMEAALRFAAESLSEDCRKMAGLVQGDLSDLVQVQKGEKTDINLPPSARPTAERPTTART